MTNLTRVVLLSSALTLAACGQAGKQWLDPDKAFALFDQPEVKGVNDTQEEMANAALKNGDFAKAAQNFQQLIISKKGTPEQQLRYRLGMAEATRRMDDHESALAMYDELLKDHPSNADVQEGRGLCLMALGKTVDAGRAFSEVIEKDSKRWRSLNALGILFVTKNMIPEAMAYYTEALALSPENAAVLNNVGLSQAVDRNFPRAAEAFARAVRASKMPAQKKQIELNHAMVLGVSGDMEQAREIASRYYEGPALANNLGLYAHLAKDDNLARTYLNMALTQSPTYYERAWQNLDAVGAEQSGGTLAPRTATSLPSTRMLEQPDAPVPQAAPTPPRPKYSPKQYGKGKKASAPAKPASEPAPATAPVMLPEVNAEQSAAPAAPAPEKPVTEKPAGLVVGPGE